MTAQTATEALVTPKGARRRAERGRGRISHKGAILIFMAPFVILFVLFYLVPIGYAIWQSLLVVEREGTFGEAKEVFGGLDPVRARLPERGRSGRRSRAC